jgi:hypothetical protein
MGIEMMAKAIKNGTMPLERTFTIAKPFPSYEVLAQAGRARARTAGI